MSVVPAWENKKPIDHEGIAKVDFANKAKAQGMWIYDKTTHILYTPTEFVWDRSIDIKIIKQHKADLSNFEYREPLKYIAVREVEISKLRDEIQAMYRRIWQYYKLIPKK